MGRYLNNSMENYSEIDSIIIIDGKKEYLKSKLSYCTKNRDLKILGITLNHRFFSLKKLLILTTQLKTQLRA